MQVKYAANQSEEEMETVSIPSIFMEVEENSAVVHAKLPLRDPVTNKRTTLQQVKFVPCTLVSFCEAKFNMACLPQILMNRPKSKLMISFQVPKVSLVDSGVA